MTLMFARWAAATNLCTNGGFETNTTGWAGFGGTLSSSTDVTKFGARSMKDVHDGTAGTSLITYTFTAGDLVDSQPTVVSGYVYIPTASTFPNDWTIRIEGISLTGVSQTFSATVASTVRDTWTRIWTIITPGTDVTGTFRVRSASGSNVPSGATIYFDGFQIEQNVSIPSPYIETDGGTANRSAGPVILDSANPIKHTKAQYT